MEAMEVKQLTNAEKYALALEAAKRRALEDIVFYVETFVTIEDRDEPEIYIPFKLWDGQKEALCTLDENKWNIVLKARQLGFTWLALAYASRGLLFRQGYSVVALSRTEDEAKELVRRMDVILSHMPDFILPEKDAPPGWSGCTYTKTALTIEIKKGEEAVRTFKAFTSSADAGRSFTASLIILDEWAFQQFDREIWNAGLPTINRPTGGKVIGLSTIKRGSLFEELFQTPDNGFKKIFYPWTTDPRRTVEWYETTKRLLGDSILAEYPATVEEAMTTPGGAFFPELRAHIHLYNDYDDIPEHWRRYVSIDYGLDALAALWYAMDENGDVLIYKEIFKGKQAFRVEDKKELIVRDAAEELLRVNDGDPICEWYAPPDLWNRNKDTGRGTAQIFSEEYGIDLSKTSNDRVQGWLDVKEWIKPIGRTNLDTGEKYVTSRMRISRKCENLWKSMLGIQKDEHNWNDVANDPHAYTHLPDSLRAFCAGQPLPKEAETEKKKPVHWHKDQWEDYENAPEEQKPYLISKWGNPFG